MLNHEFTMTESEATLNDESNDDQLIRLCLKKPKKWNWELTTSKSSSNIAFPTIQLYDENSDSILAEATEAGFVASSKLRKSASVSKASSLRSVKTRDSLKIRIKKDFIEEIALEPIITEPDDEKAHSKANGESPIFSERGLSANSMEFKRSNEKTRTKPYSRSSSNSMRSRSSVSILERISELKRSPSSDESDDGESGKADAADDHKYSYRTCTLGTIIVPKESFSKVRRRPKKCADDAGESSDINTRARIVYF